MALRRLADRLAPAPVGDCGSGATWFGYTLDVPAGATSVLVGPVTQNQVYPNPRFEQGEGWSPA